ncbi:hypothetical protein ZWY2020_015266 [Hordeum vulgare]|nr:hypothetical protein ZWY2020_015266 [Hordeum vulgare]
MLPRPLPQAPRPLLGFMRRWEYGMGHEFVPLPRKKPDRIPPARFAVPRSCNPQDHWDSSATAHSLAGMLNASRRKVVVWDPLTGQQHHVVPFPPEIRSSEGKVMSGLSIHLWERKLNTGGVVGWVLLQKTIPQEIMFPQRMRSDHKQAAVVGYDYDEESNVVVLATFTGDFMLRLESMRFRRISERNVWDNNTIHYPYRNFYTVGSGVGWKWLDLKL